QTGAQRSPNPLHEALKIGDTRSKKIGSGEAKFIYYPSCPGRAYYAELRKEFNPEAGAGKWIDTAFDNLRKATMNEILHISGIHPSVTVNASPFVSTQIAALDNKPAVFLANFKGLKSNESAEQLPEEHVTVTFRASKAGAIRFLPFLGPVKT